MKRREREQQTVCFKMELNCWFRKLKLFCYVKFTEKHIQFDKLKWLFFSKMAYVLRQIYNTYRYYLVDYSGNLGFFFKDLNKILTYFYAIYSFFFCRSILRWFTISQLSNNCARNNRNIFIFCFVIGTTFNGETWTI